MSDIKSHKKPNPKLILMVWMFVIIVICIGVAYTYQKYQEQPKSTQIFDLDAKDASYRPPPKVSKQKSRNDSSAEDIINTSIGLKPNLVRAKLVVPDRPHDPNQEQSRNKKNKFQRRRSFLVSSNENGLRIPDSSTSQNSDLNVDFQIVCIGASESFGWGVNYEYSFPALLEKMLNVRVINASAPGATPNGLIRWTKRNLQSLEPDLIIFAIRPEYQQDNPIPNFYEDLQLLTKIAGDLPIFVVLTPLSTFDFQYPDLKRLYPHAENVIEEDSKTIKNAIQPIPVLELTDIFREKQMQYVSRTPREHIVLFQQQNNIQKLVSPEGDVFLQTQVPRRDPRQTNHVFISPMIFQAFEQNNHLREPLFFDGGHPDKEGYELFANSVGKWIQQQGILP
jgi:lysophospholipase L1-like esterase